MLIYDSDEKWLAKNHGNYDNVSLARYYMDYVRLYDPGLDSTALVTRIIRGEYVAAFPSVREEFFGPYVESHRLLTTRIFKQNTTENFTSVAVNAYYHDSENKVTIPVGILQPPFFINGASSAFNYGALGQAIGHEIMHAFDANGITYSYRFTRHDLWNTPTMRQYKEKVLCLRASYQRAEAASRARTLSDNTDSEGFADFSGILLAYAAYQRLPDHLRTQMVPNVGLSADQTFFVSHCLKWCDSNAEPRRTPGSKYWAVRSRCIVPLQNMPEFANAFSCKPGDFMNPRDRCYFW
ncbi:hypothetical protein V5799_013206 [Amblyomma americanum]|uniref:Peptidase M13 C-terminal domain-containing protein n=1 Tax=Amblyomma americanum TaxID=6943 RepID=A0AAQ4E6I1_AMBAM